jgi:hypothetical protein
MSTLVGANCPIGTGCALATAADPSTPAAATVVTTIPRSAPELRALLNM